MVRRRQCHRLAVRVFAGWSERMGRKLPGTKARAESMRWVRPQRRKALTTRLPSRSLTVPRSKGWRLNSAEVHQKNKTKTNLKKPPVVPDWTKVTEMGHAPWTYTSTCSHELSLVRGGRRNLPQAATARPIPPIYALPAWANPVARAV